MLPTCRTTTKMTGIESPDWRLFTDGGLKRQIDGTEMAGWRIAVVSPENFVRILCGPVLCDPRLPAFQGPRPAATTQPNSLFLSEAFRWAHFSIPRGERVRILFDSKHAARVTLGVADVTSSCCV